METAIVTIIDQNNLGITNLITKKTLKINIVQLTIYRVMDLDDKCLTVCSNVVDAIQVCIFHTA